MVCARILPALIVFKRKGVQRNLVRPLADHYEVVLALEPVIVWRPRKGYLSDD